jgi:hypothetical protein
MLDAIREEATQRRDQRALERLASEHTGDGDGRHSFDRVSLTSAGADTRELAARRAATLLSQLVPESEEPEHVADQARQAQRIQAFADRLAPSDRILFQALLDGLTLPEIRTALGWSQRTAERRKASLVRRMTAACRHG